ncbi:hypothetical protein D3C78_983910 [compost metagenome]
MMTHLLPPSLLPQLERLSIISNRRVRGITQGKRRSGRLGASLEFADYREYAPGDDIRRFDWGVYSRTGRPFIRQYWDEQELSLSLYVDVSASMNFGENGHNKLLYAKQLAASVGYMALASHDRVQAFLCTDVVKRYLPSIRGKASASRLFSFFEGDLDREAASVQESSKELGNLATALRQPEAIPRRPGMTWIFSDFWQEDGFQNVADAIALIQASGQDIVLVHVMSAEEMEPALSGDLRLIDSELGTGKEVALTGKILESYKLALRQYTMEISSFCSERGIRYVQAPTYLPLDRGIFDTLRTAGAIGI